MTYEQYWHGDVWMVEAYREAEKLRQQRENVQAWLQGMYVYDAIARISPVLHAFAKKGTKPQPYPEKPYALKKEDADEADEARQAENERLRATLFFRNWARSVQKSLEKQKEVGQCRTV